MRSGYEVMFAEILDRKGVVWEYEPKLFKLKPNMRYRPDFYTPATNEWFEVKGYFKPESKEKVKEFQLQGHKLSLITLKEIENDHPMKYYAFRKKWLNSVGN